MLTQQDLVPYVSAAVARAPSSGLSTLVDAIRADVAAIIPTSPGDAVQREVVEQLAAITNSVSNGSLQSAAVIYRETRTPRWAPDSDLDDVKHHLVVVCRRSRMIGIYSSDSGMGRRLGRLIGAADQPALGSLDAFEPSVLNGAFLSGEARTVWMSGLHRRTAYKADSKILSGTDLRAAFEPLGDQTYRFTAARGALADPDVPGRAGTEIVVGVSPRKSRIWAGPSKSWTDFVSVMWRLLGLADDGVEVVDPLPVLASPAGSAADLDGPYDVSVIDPTLLSADGPADDERREEAEKWADRASFVVAPGVDPLGFAVTTSLDGVQLGDLQVSVGVDADGSASVEVEPPVGAGDDLVDAAAAASHRDWLTIRYESGHTVAGGLVFCPRFRDQQFTGWMWDDFDVNGRDFDVTKEKPNRPGSTAFDPAAIGAPGERSLFSWTLHHWRDQQGNAGTGWLASDDGANEIADFVHIDGSGTVPLLSLIHVKGSGSEAQGRQVSTSDYEVVTGQAIKNLRFLDVGNLAAQLADGSNKAVAQANWLDSVQQDPNRAALVAHVQSLGTNIDVQIVVLQPRVTKQEHDAARADAAAGNETSKVKRMRQLDALLLEAQSACQSLNARFVVVGDRQGVQ